MESLAKIGLGNLIAVGALIAAVVGLGFTAVQIQKNTATQRGIFFKQLYETFFLDEELQYAFQLIERGEHIFKRRFGASDPEEGREKAKSN